MPGQRADHVPGLRVAHRRRGRWLGATAALALLAGAQPAGSGEALPYDLTVGVEWSAGTAGTSARPALERALLASGLRQCFRSVEGPATAVAPSPDRLWLQLQVLDYREELELDYGIADQARSDFDARGRASARVDASVLAEVRTADGLALRQRTFRATSSWTPIATEDAREQAQARWIESIVRSTRAFACKGSARSWSARIEQARMALPAR